MRHSAIRHFMWIVPVLLLSAVSAWAAQPDRITAPIDNSQTVVLKGSVHPKAQPQFDQGPVDPAWQLGHITLEITPSPSQQAALDQLLAEQQDSTSPNYHQWLTPEQYADRFGLSRSDVSRITAWLKSQGFAIVQVARGRNWIAFSGTAAQVQSAFHTQIRRYHVDDEEHYDNSTDISLPNALAVAVTSVRGLHDFLWKPFIVRRSISQGSPNFMNPDYSNGSGNFLAPDDIATIYHIAPLYAAGIDGTNMNLVIVGQTDIATTDITQFRSGFNLPAINLQQILATSLGCVDPGTTGDLDEADLDIEWSSAVARNAKIIFVKCDTKHGGVFTSAQYAIDNKLAPVISMSYGGCEVLNGKSNALAIQSFVQQANSEGTTFFASSGDSGAAACDSSTGSQASQGLAVNLPASVPEVTGVGGTEFNEGSGNYWGSNGPNHGSALGPIPEMGWDDSSAGTGFASGHLASTGGGKSMYFAKPSWQVGSGVPIDSARDVPDVALTASADHDGYIFCTGGSCAGGVLNGGLIVGGTSASTPVFAGIVALLNQYLVKNGILSKPGLANINPTLYQFVQSMPTAFHDVPAGSYNISGANANPSGNEVPCANPSPNCPTHAPFQFGFLTRTGYDQVTGLGSVDANNFVTLWSSISKIPTTTTVTVSPTSVNAGTTTPVTLKAAVAHASGSGTPTGTVTFFSNGSKVGTGTLSSGTASFSYKVSSLTGGTYSITATYGGDTNFASSTSAAATLNVQDFKITASPTTVTVSAPGHSGTTTLTITALGGFSGTLTYTCSPLPSEANCTFTSNSANSETLTITTTAASSQLHEGPFGRRSGPFYALLLPGIVGLLIPAGKRKPTIRGMRLLGLLAVLAFSTLWIASCGGGPSNPGTPTGTSTVTVTAAATGLSHPVSITLTVQ